MKEDTGLEELAKSLRIGEVFRNEKIGKERGVLVVESGQSSEGYSYKGKKKAKFRGKDKKREIVPRENGVAVVHGLVKVPTMERALVAMKTSLP
ncbi:hypothetical protein LIER_35820 [Lithospermum erythrorhizon]|uniref:Uncharacterized protein n=1 Tax=Lithospermum erythrorhizon TaxID=34254 RepID=A0AAV3P1F0_LITER